MKTAAMPPQVPVWAVATGLSDGSAVSLAGTWLVIGAPGDDNAGGIDAGAVYNYWYKGPPPAGTTWVNEIKLLAGDGAAGANFGNAVAILDSADGCKNQATIDQILKGMEKILKDSANDEKKNRE